MTASGSVKSPRSVAGGSAEATTRGEADGSPAPLSTDSAAGAGSETPSLTSPTSTTSTTSLSAHQQQQQASGAVRNIGGQPLKDFEGDPYGNIQASASRSTSQRDDPASASSARVAAAAAAAAAADDTDQGESDLDSPN